MQQYTRITSSKTGNGGESPQPLNPRFTDESSIDETPECWASKPKQNLQIMAKTEFTAIRLGAIQRRLQYDMWMSLSQIKSNIDKFKEGERTARETLSRHRLYVENYLWADRNYLRAVEAANRMDGCAGCKECHEVSSDYSVALDNLYKLCEFFERK